MSPKNENISKVNIRSPKISTSLENISEDKIGFVSNSDPVWSQSRIQNIQNICSSEILGKKKNSQKQR